MVNVESINFPVIYFNKFSFYIVDNIDKLTTTTKAGLKNKLYDDLIIVDCSGKCFKVKDAEKMFGIGFLWGYNVFFNQKIKIKLNFSEDVTNFSLQELKKVLLKILQKDKYFWESGGNLKQMEAIVENAESITILIKSLSEVINFEY
ncbi:MAG: hypothetical protein IM577_11140 [Chitinophagaceae bacterium]|nr:hypothetical protein [Chitinophagaceae bacterium]